MMMPGFDWNEEPQLNITPLVDVMLVLLAILMLSAPIVIYTEDITLPKGSATRELSVQKKIRIAMNAQGSLKLDGQPVEAPQLLPMLKARTFEPQSQPVVLMADKTLPYGSVMGVLAMLKQGGFEKISLATER